MKILEAIVAAAILALVVTLMFLIPGGRLNRHDWFSSHMTSANGSAVMLRAQKDPKAPAESFCFDICVKHGEWKRVPCPQN